MNRTVQLGLLLKDYAVFRWSDTDQRDERRRRVIERLGLLHGLPQKIGQLLAFSELETGGADFTRLTENEPSMSFDEAAGEIDRQLARLGAPARAVCFPDLDPIGIAASIGQVHRATLRDGRKVAVKVQYPDLAGALEQDLRALGWLTTPVGDLRRGFDLPAYRNEIGAMLRDELDYTREAEATREMAGRIAEAPELAGAIETPSVIEDLSNDRLFTATWLEGKPFAETRQWSASQREQTAATLLRLFLRSCFQWRRLHADPHPGNYRFSLSAGRPRIGLLDFGCVKTIPDRLASGLFRLARAGTDRDENIRIHHAMGFNAALLEPLHARLPELCAVLFEPFREDRPFDPGNWNLRSRIAALLGPDRMNYRLAGPPEMIYLLRAFQGLAHYLAALQAPINWAAILGESADCAPDQQPSTTVTGSGDEGDRLSQTLHVSVMEHGREKVSIVFPAAAAENLRDLVPPDLQPKLAQRGIDLGRIIDKARANRFAPGELFRLDDAPRSVRVWLA